MFVCGVTKRMFDATDASLRRLVSASVVDSTDPRKRPSEIGIVYCAAA